VSTFDFTDLLLVGVEAFLLTIVFFSMAIVISPVLINCLTPYLVQAGGQTLRLVHTF
jgi:hypothetical protein